MMEINRSMSPENVATTRALLEEQGWVEAVSVEEARELEAQGKNVFVDHTKSGAESFSREEMEDFRNTPIEDFPAHLRRWGRDTEPSD